jgi:Copper amine oxidase N-terminal domain
MILCTVIIICLMPNIPQTYSNNTSCEKWTYDDWEYLDSTSDGLVVMLNKFKASEGYFSLQCMSTNTGKFIWSEEVLINCYNIEFAVGVADTFSTNISGNYIFVIPHEINPNQNSLIYCISLITGRVVWIFDRYKDFGNYRFDYESTNSTFVDENLYLLAHERYIINHFKVNTDSCKHISKYDVREISPKHISYTAQNINVDENKKFMIISGFYLACYDISNPENITLLWDNSNDIDLDDFDNVHNYRSRVTMHDDKVIFLGYNKNNPPQNYSIFCKDLKSGDVLWQLDGNVDEFYYSKTSICEDRFIYLDCKLKNNSKDKKEKRDNIPAINACDVNSGELIWSNKLEYLNKSVQTYFGNAHLKVNKVDKFIYAGSIVLEDSKYSLIVTKIDTTTGNILWRDDIPIEIKDPRRWYTMYMHIENGRIYLDNEILHVSIPLKDCDIGVKHLRFNIQQKVMIVDGVDSIIDVTPVIQNGRTLLPARYVTEPLEGIVTWVGSEKKVVCELGDNVVELWIGKSTAKVNSVEVQIDPNNPEVVSTIISDRTMGSNEIPCRISWV